MNESTEDTISTPHDLFGICEALMKRPLALIHELADRDLPRIALWLMAISLVGFAVFGAALGSFAGGDQVWQAPLKVLLAGLGTGVITLPSLFVFTCLSGYEISLRQVAIQMLGMSALTAMLLLGVSPVVWVFAQSTTSVAFFSLLSMTLGLAAFAFGYRLLEKTRRLLGCKPSLYSNLWLAIFAFVSLQMMVSLKPIEIEPKVVAKTAEAAIGR